MTVFHAVTADLEIDLPWPRPESYNPAHATEPFLIWGGASSVGQYALQILKHWGYRNLFATASPSHHEFLRSLGATQVFDYRDPQVTELILDAANRGKDTATEPSVPFVLDCIGSKYGSIAPIAKIAQKGSKVAVLLPIIVRDSSDEVAPEYAMDVQAAAEWNEGVVARGVRTHFYLEVSIVLGLYRAFRYLTSLQNKLFAKSLQPEIMPALLADGVVKPNRQRLVEGKTLLERAQKALDALRRKEVSGERLVWRVSD